MPVPTVTDEVVECTRTWAESGGLAYTGRHLHVIDLDATRVIDSDRVWIGGRWPEELPA